MRPYTPNTRYMSLDDVGVSLDNSDRFIIGMLESLGIEVDIAFTSNFCICKAHNSRSRKYSVLWDMSYWELYKKYLQFYYSIHRLPNVCTIALTEEEIINTVFREHKIMNFSNGIAERTSMLGSLFMYLSLKFYYDEPLSYFFSLLFNTNNIAIVNSMSDEEAYQYTRFINTHLSITKLFCAGHEVAHMPEMHNTPRDTSWVLPYFEDILTGIQIPLSKVYSGINLNEMALQRLHNTSHDKLLDEIVADIEGLSVLRNAYKANMFDCSFEEYASMVLFFIETFYDFQALISATYEGWKNRLNTIKGKNAPLDDGIETYGVDHLIRSMVLPLTLSQQFWEETDYSKPVILPKYDVKKGKNNNVDIKQELNNLVTMSFNNILAEVIKHSYKDGYKNAVSSIDKARDKLLQLTKNEAAMRIPAEDIYIKGGKFCENDFYVFANRYRFY